MEINSLGKDPIQPDQPAGSDVRYGPEFEQLQAEIDKLTLPSASGGINWEKVGDIAASILAKQSKDLLVAGYLAVSQIYVRRIEGLADGLTVMHDLLENFWDDLFPPKKRMRGRLGAIEWWIEKTETALKGIKPESDAGEKRSAISTTLTQIDPLLVEHLPDPPMLRSIETALENIFSTAEETAEAQVAPTVEQTESERVQAVKPESRREPTGPSVAPEPGAFETEQDAQKIISSGMQKMRQAATALLEHNPTNAMAYRYQRIAAWSVVSSLPPESNGQTHIMPPPPHVLQSLLKLKETGNWGALILSAEQHLSQFIFWFDLNRLVSEALNSLGDDYRSAHEEVCQNTAFFIRRFPPLAGMSFSDGTPFADPETRQWLNDISFGASLVAETTISKPGTTGEIDESDRRAAVLAEAQALVKKKKLPNAVQLLHNELKTCVSQQEALMWRLALCRMLIASKRTDMALPHLDLILKDIETYRLETWNPHFAMECLTLVWAGYTSHTDKEVKGHAKDVLSLIAKLDPAEALKLSKH
ncbi:MAG: type VI secretion system protein TssA [Deltaproteobacteria bacterium]|nr:type VI secretion system protein TssA [Deltaproteobacteria bacterium]